MKHGIRGHYETMNDLLDHLRQLWHWQNEPEYIALRRSDPEEYALREAALNAEKERTRDLIERYREEGFFW